MEVLIAIVSFLISVATSVLANFLYDCICKWLDGRKK